MRLIELVKGLDDVLNLESVSARADIAGLTCDSRAVRAGFLFAALPGAKVDGRDFIDDALSAGATYVLAPYGTTAAVPVLEAGNPRLAFARMAANFCPGQPETIAAVTGTNGKTSTVTFLRQIWQHLGHNAASLGTLGVEGRDFHEPGGLTTPDPVKLHETLNRLYGGGIDHLAMEASSHGLSQYRLDGVKVRAAAFTNLSRDHLDFHESMADYLSAKMRLFTEVLANDGTAVINADTSEGREIIERARARGLNVISYGRAGGRIRLLEREAKGDAQQLILMVGDRNFTVKLPLAGRFQAENALCALGLAIACGADVNRAVKALEHLEPVPGRLQLVGQVAGGDVYVDYAHTPGALETVLTALRPHTKGELHVLFGCGGDRDAGKRAEMGRVAQDLADRVIVTDDNPRSEDPAAIRREVLQGAPDAIEIGERKAAVQSAIEALRAGDVLVLAGKGHEEGQIVGDDVLPYSDVKQARAVIDALKENGPSKEVQA